MSTPSSFKSDQICSRVKEHSFILLPSSQVRSDLFERDRESTSSFKSDLLERVSTPSSFKSCRESESEGALLLPSYFKSDQSERVSTPSSFKSDLNKRVLLPSSHVERVKEYSFFLQVRSEQERARE